MILSRLLTLSKIRDSHAVLLNKTVSFVCIVTVAALLCGVGTLFGWFEEFENKTWDTRIRSISPFVTKDPRIKIIVVDQSSLTSRAKDTIYWPWPRQMYVPLIEFLNQAGAAGVAFDILYTEPSAYQVDDDRQFAKAVAQSKVPVILAATPVGGAGESASEEPIQAQLVEHLQREDSKQLGSKKYLIHPQVRTFDHVLAPIPELIDAARSFGSVKGRPDSDGIYRHIEPGVVLKKSALLTLPFALYTTTTPRSVWSSIADSLDEEGRLALRFFGPRGTYPTYRYDTIVESYLRLKAGKKPLVPLEDFKGSYVFIGLDAPGLFDLRPTALGDSFPGVEVNATALDNLINGNFARKFPLRTSVLVGVLFTIICAASVLFVASSAGSAFIVLILCSGLYLALTYLSAIQGYWLPVVWNSISIIGSGIAALFVQYWVEGRQYRFIKGAFQQYVSSEVIEKISRDPTSLSLGGEKRELTIFFSDIAGFTSFSEQMEPSDLVLLLNDFLSNMTEIIMRWGGTVDKYVGDAIVAFWNAPLSQADHAYRGVMAALECQRKIKELESHYDKRFGVKIKMRIGIHTGVVSVGNFGSKARFTYTVLGDAANLASRLEGVNKQFNTALLISNQTREHLTKEHGASAMIHTRCVGEVRVVGRAEPVEIYEPYEEGAYAGTQIKEFIKALEYFRKGALNQAAEAFTALVADPVALVYLKRIAHEKEKRQQEEGAATQWSPVWHLAEK